MLEPGHSYEAVAIPRHAEAAGNTHHRE